MSWGKKVVCAVVGLCSVIHADSATTPPPLSPLPPFLPPFLLSLSLSVTACLLFHPSIEQEDKNRSNFSWTRSLANGAAASERLRFQMLDGRPSAFGGRSRLPLAAPAPCTFPLAPMAPPPPAARRSALSVVQKTEASWCSAQSSI